MSMNSGCRLGVDPKISHWNGTADLKDVSDIGSKPPTDRL
jgi:hypothetical protein